MYAVDSFLEVLADGLAVRTGPGTDHPLAAEFLLHRDPSASRSCAMRFGSRLATWCASNLARWWWVIEPGTRFTTSHRWPGRRGSRQLGLQAARPRRLLRAHVAGRCGTRCPSSCDPPTVRHRHAHATATRPPPLVVATGVGDGRVGPWNNDRVAFIEIAASPVIRGRYCDFWVSGRDGDTPLISEVATDSFEALLPSIDVAPGMDEAGSSGSTATARGRLPSIPPE